MPFQGKVFIALLTILKDISLPTSLHYHALQIITKLCGHYEMCVEGLLLKYFIIYMATAAKGHELMVRVQQLETEVPSIEKALMSETNQLHFAYTIGKLDI